MKKIITIAAAMLLMAAACLAQDGKSIYNKYSNEKGVSAVYISPAMFKMMKKIPDISLGDDDVNLTPIVKAMNGLYIINSENPRIKISLSNDVEKALGNGRFEKLMEAIDDGETVKIYTRNDGEYILNLILLANDSDECTFISLDGKMLEKDLTELLGKSMR